MLLVLLGSAAAQAHERTASTSLTLKANKSTVDQGDEVKFRGKLRSDWKECRKSKSVTLYRDGTAVASTTTSRSGNYSFVMQIDATADWHVTFAGTEWGQHPHSHVCLGSSSTTIRIRVRGGGGVAGAGGARGGRRAQGRCCLDRQRRPRCRERGGRPRGDRARRAVRVSATKPASPTP